MCFTVLSHLGVFSVTYLKEESEIGTKNMYTILQQFRHHEELTYQFSTKGDPIMVHAFLNL